MDNVLPKNDWTIKAHGAVVVVVVVVGVVVEVVEVVVVVVNPSSVHPPNETSCPLIKWT